MSDEPAEYAATLFDESSRLSENSALAAASATVRRSLKTMRPHEATPFCERAIDVFEQNFTADHPTLLAARDCLSALDHHSQINLEDL